jgi:hypothetical protein
VEIGVWGWANLYVNPCSSTSWGGEALEIRLIQLSRAGHNIIGVMQRTYEGSQTPVIIHVNKYNSIRRNQYLPNFFTFKIWYAHMKIILTIEVVIIIFLNNFILVLIISTLTLRHLVAWLLILQAIFLNWDNMIWQNQAFYSVLIDGLELERRPCDNAIGVQVPDMIKKVFSIKFNITIKMFGKIQYCV